MRAMRDRPGEAKRHRTRRGHTEWNAGPHRDGCVASHEPPGMEAHPGARPRRPAREVRTRTPESSDERLPTREPSPSRARSTRLRRGASKRAGVNRSGPATGTHAATGAGGRAQAQDMNPSIANPLDLPGSGAAADVSRVDRLAGRRCGNWCEGALLVHRPSRRSEERP